MTYWPATVTGPPSPPRWAAAGAGEEAPRLRRQALEWLRADLVGRTRSLEGATPEDAIRLQSVLRTWQFNPALAGVREADRLATLPATERAAWQHLWADVATSLAPAGD